MLLHWIADHMPSAIPVTRKVHIETGRALARAALFPKGEVNHIVVPHGAARVGTRMTLVVTNKAAYLREPDIVMLITRLRYDVPVTSNTPSIEDVWSAFVREPYTTGFVWRLAAKDDRRVLDAFDAAAAIRALSLT